MALPFVILHHTFSSDQERESHYDLMLQDGDVLKTWELLENPLQQQQQQVQSLFDHRLNYLKYEGPISDNRGEVTRWVEGSYVILSHDPDNWEISVDSEKITGSIRLSKTNTSETSWDFKYITAKS